MRVSFLLLLFACASVPPRDVLSEARSFMQVYAQELRAGDPAALAARYDPRGGYHVGNGRKMQVTAEQTKAFYADETKWKPPAAFEWQDLSYEVLGPDAVVVVGTFTWDEQKISYTSLLIRDPADGKLKIRLEDESGICKQQKKE